VVPRDQVDDLAIVGIEHDLDVGMAQHRLEHPRVAVLGHGLIGVGEVAVVAVGSSGNPRRHARVELGRIESPLLAGVAAEELVVEITPDLGHHRVLGRLDAIELLGNGVEPALHLERREVEPVQAVDGVEVDRHRQLLAIDAGEHPVLIRAPLGELRQVLEDVGRVRVEDVRAVRVDQDPRVVVAVVGVATDVRALVDDENALVALAGQPLGEHAAGETRTHHQGVEAGAAGNGVAQGAVD
jgi:hypothetical protein